MSAYVLDSFAILARYWLEPGHARVRQVLSAAEATCWMTTVNLGEVYYRVAREEDVPSAEKALIWLETLPIRFVEADRMLTLEAARLKARYPLAYADCFAAAAARQHSAAVITGDPEFEQLEADGIVAVEWLPHRPKRRR